MAHFGGGASTFAVSSSSSSSAAATDRTAEFLRLAAAAKAAQVRGGIFSWYFASVSLSSLSRATKRERERANRREREREREERERKARMVIFFSIDGLSTFVSPFSLDSTSSPCPLFPSILSTHRTRRVCLTREVRSGGRADFRAGKKEEENSKTAASPFFSSSFLSFNLHLSLPPLASFGTAPSFAPSSITSSSANPFSAASSTATAQSDFARRAAAVGAGIHTTSERLKALAALARRTSSFDDPAAEIADLSARIKRDIAGLNGALSELAAVGARSRAAAAASSAAAQQQQHSATVVDGLRLRLRDAASQFRDVLDARQKSLAAHADRRARFSSAAGASTSSSATGAGAAAAAAGAAGAAPAAPLPPFGRGGSSLAPRHQPLFAPRPPPRPPMGGASAGNGGPASAAFAGTTTTAAAAEKCVSDSSNPSSSFSSAAAAPSFPQPPPLGTAQPFLRQRGGMARYGGGGGGGGGGAR